MATKKRAAKKPTTKAGARKGARVSAPKARAAKAKPGRARAKVPVAKPAAKTSLSAAQKSSAAAKPAKAAPAPGGPAPEAGSRAPDFTLEGDDGQTHTLSALRGKHVVVYFYPRDDTPGCTREAQGFEAARAAFTAKGAVVFGVSKDSIASHCRFRDKYRLGFTLLSEPELAVHRAYVAYGEKVM